jgi:hypothetical protein
MRTVLLSDEVVARTRRLASATQAKWNTDSGTLSLAYSTAASGVMTRTGSGWPEVPRKNAPTTPRGLVNTRQSAGTGPRRAWSMTSCGLVMSNPRGRPVRT